MAHALDPVIAAMDDVAARRHQEKMQRQQQEAIDRRAQTDDQLNREKFESERLGRNISQRSATEEKVREALDRGEYDRAKAIAAGHQEVGKGNTVDKGLPGFSLELPDAVPAPPEAPAKPKDVEYGPQATPEISMNAAKWRAEAASFEPGAGPDSQYVEEADAERERFNATQGDGRHEQAGGGLIPAQYLESVAAHDQAMGMWRDRANTPEATVAGQPYDVRGTRNAQSQRRVEDARETEAAFRGKADSRHVDLLTAMVGSGASQEKAAMAAPGMMTKDQLLAFRAAQDERNKAPWQIAEAGKDRRAIIGANSRVQAAGTARPPAPLPTDRLSEKYLNPINSQIANLQREFQLKTNRQELDNTEMVLNNSKDPVMQRSMVYNVLARGLAGEKGPLSKDDVTRIQGRLGGVVGDMSNWTSIISSGSMSDAQLQAVLPAVNAVIARDRAAMGRAAERYDAGLTNNAALKAIPGASDHIRARRAELFGEEAPQQRAPGGVDPRIEEVKRLLKE